MKKYIIRAELIEHKKEIFITIRRLAKRVGVCCCQRLLHMTAEKILWKTQTAGFNIGENRREFCGTKFVRQN